MNTESVKRELDDLDRVVMLNSKITGSGYLLAFLGYACCHFAKASQSARSEVYTSVFYLLAAIVMATYLWQLRKLCVHAQQNRTG